MRRRRAVMSTVAATLLVATWSPVASASHNADDHSPNARLLANIPRSSETALGGENFQSDLAFTGNYAIAGNYNGFRIIDISDPANPAVVRDVWCPGPQNDVSVWGDAIVLSVDLVMTDSGCTATRAVPQTLETGWEGLRVFSLSEVLATEPDPDGFTRLEPATTIYTACGSHTHTGVPDGDRVLIYVSSYSLRSGPDCGPHDDPSDTHDPLHMMISIAEVFPDDPAASRFLKTSPVDMPPWTDLANVPGFNPLGGCHDIQAYPSQGLAAAACASVGQLWDISDPENPRTADPLWQVDEPDVDFYHSAAFTWDTKVVIFGDESTDGDCASEHGKVWFHSGATGETLGSFQIPRPQPEGQYCSAHLFHVLKTGSYKLVAAWYSGGVTVIQFRNPADAKEVAYYDPAPEPEDTEGLWSAYAYNGFVYGNGLFRGFDSYFIAPARAGGKKLTQFNPQTQ